MKSCLCVVSGKDRSISALLEGFPYECLDLAPILHPSLDITWCNSKYPGHTSHYTKVLSTIIHHVLNHKSPTKLQHLDISQASPGTVFTSYYKNSSNGRFRYPYDFPK